MKANATLPERFNAKVDRSAECWVWKAKVNNKGYGMIRPNGAADGFALAHRVAWFLHHGSLADSLLVLHRCDNPRCVRPDHLFLGTHVDNVQDMIAKGRAFSAQWFASVRAAGERRRRLSASREHLFRERASGGTPVRALAREFGVSRASIKRWIARAQLA